MALSNFPELKSAIAGYLHRSDLTAVIPDFVSLAEKRIIRDLIQRGGHSLLEASATIVPTADVAAQPTDFESVRSLVTSESNPRQIQAVPLDVLRSKFAIAGTGRAYALQGSDILLSPDAGDYSLILYYYKTPTAMDDSVNTTNQLFPALSDMYLYASLIEGSLYIKNDPTVWATAYSNALSSIVKSNRSSVWGNGLAVRPA